METGCIYRITAPNGKSYVGQAVDYVRRMREHKTREGVCPFLKNAIKKYGWDKMTKTILADDLQPGVELDSAEIYYIAYHNTFGKKGYNLTKGGGGAYGCKHPPRTDEQRANHGAARMGTKHTEATKAILSAKKMGNTNGKGKRTPEKCENMRIGNRRAFIVRCFNNKVFLWG